MHFARIWTNKTTTKSLIIELLRQGNQKQTEVASHEDWFRVGPGPHARRSAGSSVTEPQESSTHPPTDLRTENTLHGQRQMAFGLLT